MKHIPVEQFWTTNAPTWQAKLDAGHTLIDQERHRFGECMQAWSDNGLALAKTWASNEIAQFEQRWLEQLRAWEVKERQGEPFMLAERKEQQLGLGVWWWIGYTNATNWDEVAWRKFRDESVSFANADRLLAEAADPRSKKARITTASKQIWDQIGLDYLGRPMRHRQQGEFHQGAWRRLGEKEQEAFSAQIQQRESWAATQIVGWEKRGLQPDDFNFRWSGLVGTGVEDGHMALRLGVLYEYAREGRKLRGLLLLLNPDRKRKPWEKYHRPSFEGLTEERARRELYEMIDVLAMLAEPLAANLPYAAVLSTKQTLVEKALKHGRRLYRMRLRNGITSHWQLGRGAPVELAGVQELFRATTFDTTAWGGRSYKKTDGNQPLPPRRIVDGKEVIALRVDWANYRDEHLKERFGDLLKWLRLTKAGTNKWGKGVPPEPKPVKKGKKAVVLDKALNCLRAVRVLDSCHGKAANVAWEILGLNKVSSNRDESNFYRDAAEARREFKRCFPYEGEPAHNKTPRRKRS